jgi:hypothetical protein
MGMITNFSFVRGGSEGLWASNGLPLAVDVTLTVTDMYPTLSVASNAALLRQNMGLSAFLDNMCGLNVMKANISANLKANIVGKLSLFSGFGDSVQTKGADVVESVMDTIFR